MQHNDITIGHLPSGASVMAMFRASMINLISRMTPKREAALCVAGLIESLEHYLFTRSHRKCSKSLILRKATFTN